MTRVNVRRLLLPLLALVGVSGAVSLQAQEPRLPPSTVKAEDLPSVPAVTSPPVDAVSPAPPADAAAASTDAAPAPGDIQVRAEHQEGDAGHYRAHGFVDLRSGDMRIQCDALDITETNRPDGTKAQKLVAVGNVVLLRGPERLAGDRLEMDVETGLGVMENASGYVQPGVFVEAQSIERRGEKLYRIEKGRFTACAQPNPRWRFSLRSADLKLEDKVIARSAVLRVKSVPVIWLPILSYPLDREGRSTGFLFPHFGTSTVKGRNIGGGFFWAMGRSYDQTFYADYFSKVGYGFGHEFRYAGDSPSRANFTTYIYNPKDSEERDWDIQWAALKSFPGKIRFTLKVQQFSKLRFARFYQDGLNLATRRTQRSTLSLQKVFKLGTLRADAERTDVYFGEETSRQQRLPSLSFNQYPKKLGKSGLVFTYETSAASLTPMQASSSEATTDPAAADEKRSFKSYERFHLAPQISRPIQAGFLNLNPRITYYLTRYSSTYISSDDTARRLEGPGRTRPLFEANLDLRGPTFARVFQSPWGVYSDRLKHVIGPEVSWTYRTKTDDFASIPQYDNIDTLFGAHEIRYGFAQQLFARRRAANGKLMPYEFFSWRIGQTYYVKISDGENAAFSYDPNYASAGYAPGYLPAHRSDLVSNMRLRPRPGWSADVNMYYNVNYDQIYSTTVSTTVGGEHAAVQAGWTERRQLSEDRALRTPQSSMLRGSGRLAKLPGGLSFEGSADYNFATDTLYQASARIKWDVQCCGVVGEVVRTNWMGGAADWTYRVSLSLANVGSMPAFMGMGAQQRQGALGGQR